MDRIADFMYSSEDVKEALSRLNAANSTSYKSLPKFKLKDKFKLYYNSKDRFIIKYKRETIGYIFIEKRVNIKGVRVKQVSEVGLLKSYRGQGLITKAYIHIINKLGALASDSTQTVKGNKIWKRLSHHRKVLLFGAESESWYKGDSISKITKLKNSKFDYYLATPKDKPLKKLQKIIDM